MGILDSAFDLPKVASSVGTTLQNTVTNAYSYTLANAQTKVSEAAGSIASTLGGSGGPFSKLGANLPTFDSLKAAAMKAGSTLLGGTGDLVNQQIANDASQVAGFQSAAELNSEGGSASLTNHLVTLSEIGGGERVVQFDVMPEIVEARTIQYEAIAPAQFPGAFQKYKGTDSTQWTLNCTFTARTTKEATQNLWYINTLRGWSMPFFGDNTGSVYTGQLGAPPPVLHLQGLRNLVGKVPVVITSLNWNWPKDVDYLPTEWTFENTNDKMPFPAVMNVAIQLVESYSTAQFNRFSLIEYRHGEMDAAFNTPIDATPPTQSINNSADDGTKVQQNVATQADVRKVDNKIEANSVPTQADVRKFDNAIESAAQQKAIDNSTLNIQTTGGGIV